MLKSVQINWIPLYQLIIINWNNWKIETIGVCFCREIPNVGNHLREIEEGPPFLLKWVLRLDMQLQTEPEQFGIWYLWDWRGPSLPTQVTSETWFAIANRVRAIWDFWFVRLRRALSPYPSDIWDLFWNCKPSQSNLGFGIWDLWDWGGLSLPTQVTSETWYAIANRVRAIWDLLSPKQQMTFSWIEIGSLRNCPF